jgi:hypothetical protein
MYRHATDVISLVFGVIFAGFAIVWALEASNTIEAHDVWVAGPAVLIGAGVLGLVATLRPRRTTDSHLPA